MVCRFPKCDVPKIQRFGLCNRHRKWVEKGYFDKDTLSPLKPMPGKVDYTGKVCKVDGCGIRPRRNYFCPKHSKQFREGVLNVHGHRVKPFVRYSKDFTCIKCGKKDKITKGFCKYHYGQLRQGLIDFDGTQLREYKRVHAYGPDDFCRAEHCRKRPKERGFCRSHSLSVKIGTIDRVTGKRLVPKAHKNEGKSCLECDQPASTRLLCRLHYYRRYQATPRKLINKGKICVAPSCDRPAHIKQLCTKHYTRRKRRLRASVATADASP